MEVYQKEGRSSALEVTDNHLRTLKQRLYELESQQQPHKPDSKREARELRVQLFDGGVPFDEIYPQHPAPAQSGISILSKMLGK